MALAIVSLIAAAVVLQTDFGRERVRRAVARAMSDVFAGDVRIDRLEGSVFGDITLFDVVIEDAEGDAAITIGALEVEYDLWSLLGRRVVVARIDVRGLEVIARHNREQGALNLSALMAPDDGKPSSPSKWRVEVKRIDVQGQVRIYRAGASGGTDGGVLEDLFRLEVAGAAMTSAGGVTGLELGLITASSASRGRELAATGSLELAGKNVDIANLIATTDGGRVEITDLGLEDGKPVRVVASASIDERLAKTIAPLSRLGGDARIEVKAAATDADADGELALDIVAEVGSNRVTGRASISIDVLEVSMHLEATDIDLAAAWTGLPSSQLALIVDISSRGRELDELVATATVRGSGVIDGRRLDNLSGSLHLEESVAIAQAHVEPEGGLLDGSATIELLPDLKPALIRASHVVFKHRDLGSLGREDLEIAGDIDIDLTASGAPTELHIAGALSATRLDAFGARARKLSVKPDITRVGAEGARGRLTLRAASLRVAGSEVRNASITASSIDGISGELAVAGRGVGTAIDLATAIRRTDKGVRADIRRLELAFAGLTLTGGEGAVLYEWREHEAPLIGFEKVSLASPAGAIELDGEISTRGGPRGKFKLHAPGVRLAPLGRALALAMPLSGTVSLEASLDTTGRVPRASIDLFGAGVGAPDRLPPTSGRVELTLVGQKLTLDSSLTAAGTGKSQVLATIRGPRDPMSAAEWRSVDATAIESLVIDARIGDPSWFTHLHPAVPRRGSFALEVGVSGAAGSGNVVVRARDVRSARLSEPATGDLELTLKDREVTASISASVTTRATLSGAAAAQLPGPWRAMQSWAGIDRGRVTSASGSIDGVDLDWWVAQFGVVTAKRAARAAATFALEPGAAGGPTGVVTATVVQPAGGPRTLAFSTRGELAMRARPRRIEASVRGFLASTEHIVGTMAIDAGWRDLLRDPTAFATARISGSVTLDGLPLAAARDQLRGTGLEDAADIDGTISGNASASGTTRRPAAAASITIDGARIAGVGFRRLTASGSYRDGRVVLDAEGRQSRGGALVAHASSDLSLTDANAPLSATLGARDFDLAFLSELLPGSGIAGVLQATITAGGTRATPVVIGSASLARGRVLAGAPFYPLRDIDLSLRLASGGIAATGKATSGRGTLEFEAAVGLRSGEPQGINASITTRRLPLEVGGLLMMANTRTTVTGTASAIGDWKLVADIGKTRIDLPDERARTLHPTDRPGDLVYVSELEKELEKPRHRAPRPPIAIELRVRAPGTIEVRGRQANAVFDGDLQIIQGDDLKITGTIRGERGSLDLFGHRYDVRRALVSFGGDPDPGVDIQLAHEFSAVTLYILISGTAGEPVVELRSDPPQYDEAELLAFVLGASPDGTDGANVRNQATGLVTGVIAGRVQSLVSDIAPIDVVKLKLGEDGTSAESLTLGRWLTSKLYVAYRHNFSASTEENSGEGTVEYRFLRRWLLEGYVGSKESGADVLFIKRY